MEDSLYFMGRESHMAFLERERVLDEDKKEIVEEVATEELTQEQIDELEQALFDEGRNYSLDEE